MVLDHSCRYWRNGSCPVHPVIGDHRGCALLLFHIWLNDALLNLTMSGSFHGHCSVWLQVCGSETFYNAVVRNNTVVVLSCEFQIIANLSSGAFTLGLHFSVWICIWWLQSLKCMEKTGEQQQRLRKWGGHYHLGGLQKERNEHRSPMFLKSFLFLTI